MERSRPKVTLSQKYLRRSIRLSSKARIGRRSETKTQVWLALELSLVQSHLHGIQVHSIAAKEWEILQVMELLHHLS